MKQIRLSFRSFTDVNLKKKSEFIYDSLINNPLYLTLGTLLPLLKVALDKYSADLAAAATNDRNAVAQKNKSRGDLEAILKQLGLAVMAEANGDEAMLTTSGFTLTKTREVRYITNPGNVTLSQGISSGQMVSAVKAMNAAKSYVHQISSTLPGDDTVWTGITSSSCKVVFESLIPGKQYWVRVAVVGSRKQIAYSNVGSWFAQ